MDSTVAQAGFPDVFETSIVRQMDVVRESEIHGARPSPSGVDKAV